ncbi:hypothetical protein EYZ11_006401 [Aspergillus tanneri]|uniref:Transcription factor domain-containing protein n=1 Tax=Aspergillus tanneri TaxID=1220188 RepID=A0A4S3JFW5_9EURO|nr:hypothetical protein EYZ11_006401 [Aspergillus tanneri]
MNKAVSHPKVRTGSDMRRRLSSSLGLPAGADERQLRAGLPRHALGFPSPVAITINVRIARVTDEIMSSLYGNASVSQLELVRKIQSTLQELHNTVRSFPHSLVLDFNRPLQSAIILCTRPILLRRVRLDVERQQNARPLEPVPDILARLCDTCKEAATRSLAILYVLQKQQTIPRYGFFDLDATFSAAFVLVMVGFIDNSQKHPPPALNQAFSVLRFLSRSGNSAAEQRLQDIAQSCSHVWPDHRFDVTPSNHGRSPLGPSAGHIVPNPSPGVDPGQSPLEYPLAPPPRYNAVASDRERYCPDESRLFEPWEQSVGSDTVFDMQGDWGVDLSGEAEGIYSSFHNPTLPLTGVDYMDWLEIEKVFNGPEGA